MNEIEVAVMEPKYQINLGYIARISKNFGVERLVLINPRCNHKGRLAVKYSKHARDLLESAKIAKSLKGLDTGLLIGTTGIWHKTGRSYYNVYNLNGIDKFLDKKKPRKVTLLLGRDDTGLSKEELSLCDATISIEANKDYPILNISHALAIMLYELSNDRKAGLKMGRYADSTKQDNLTALFERLVKSNPMIRNKKAVVLAFRHVLRRSYPTAKEVGALAVALSFNENKRKR